MGTRGKRSSRCVGCRMLVDACVCDALVPCDSAIHLAVVAHHRELKKTTNTGTLACRVLTRSAVHVWGDGTPLTAEVIVPDGHAGVVLTAAEGAEVLDPTRVHAYAAGRPIALVVPDGSWRQASKMPRRVPGLDALPWVLLPAGPPTRYRVREELRDFGLATIEAIARACGLLGDPAAQAALERAFDAMVEATLDTRGRPAT